MFGTIVFESMISPRNLSTTTTKLLPKCAQVVVIGGGIIGNSVAYHLGKRGWKDVVLLERDSLTSGTTHHSAGLMVTFGSQSETSTELRKYTKSLYQSVLEEETGQSTGFRGTGFIELATTPDYLHEFRRTAAFNRKHGVDVHEIDAHEVKKLFPLCRTDDILAGFYVPDDGRVNPVDACMAFYKGGKRFGVQHFENVSCNNVKVTNGRVSGVSTSMGDIETDYVVNCAGMWARQFGELNGLRSIPNQAAEHYYLVTDKIDEVDASFPVIEDPASHVYVRPETNGGLLIGLFEPDGAAWNVSKVPESFAFGEIEPDWDRMAPYLEKAMNRVPKSLEVGARTFFCGPESFTPDNNPIVGESPEIGNYFVAAGLNSIGILSGGGIGRLVADWIVDGKPNVDVTGMNITRFEPYQSTPMFREKRVVEALGNVYKNHYPNKQYETARNIKTSPIHNKLVERGAHFKPVSGWEGADWYDETGSIVEQSLSWNREPFFDLWKQEHLACREGVVLIDMSFMAKFMVQGEDAGAALNYLSTANVADTPNQITYTQWLNDEGKLEGDLTVARLNNDETYFVVATDTMNTTVETYLKRHVKGRHAFVTNCTGAFAQINLQGPRSRELIQKLTSVDMSNEKFPFRTMKEIDVGCARVLCARITYVGELGYELYIPTEQANHVYDEIMKHAGDVSLKHAGLKALNSLRMEKGYKDYGHDIDNTDELVSTGLQFTCDFEKQPFLGREAVLAQKERKVQLLSQRLVNILVLDPQPFLHHAEIVLRNGKVVGEVRSGSYGFSLNGAVGLAMIEYHGEPLNKKYLREGDWQVDIAGELFPIEVSLTPFYDPNNVNIKG